MIKNPAADTMAYARVCHASVLDQKRHSGDNAFTDTGRTLIFSVVVHCCDDAIQVRIAGFRPFNSSAQQLMRSNFPPPHKARHCYCIKLVVFRQIHVVPLSGEAR